MNLLKCCDNYGAKFTIKHELACKKGILVVGRQNEVKVETGGILIQALSSNRVRNKPK